jgi:hypothetical protein
MSPSRPTPFDLVFRDVAATVFPQIRIALQQAGTDPRDRDGFLMLREVVTLLRELRPDEGLGEGIDQLAALVHHSYLFWQAGSPTVEIPIEQLGILLGDPAELRDDYQDPPAYYVQLPERRVWGETVVGEPPEPLDGCLVHVGPDEMSLRVLGIFGVRADRPGFTVVEVAGPRPSALVRQDHSALFSPSLPGGAAAGLFSIAGGEELLELGWRTRTLLVPSAAEAGRWRA